MIWILRLFHRWRGHREYVRQCREATSRLEALRLLLREDL